MAYLQNTVVSGSSVSLGASYANLFLFATNALAADVGGSLGFGGYYNGTSPTQWAGIKGGKEDGTSGNYGGYLALYSRTHTGATTERMRLAPSGNIGIGGTPGNNARLYIDAGSNNTGVAFEFANCNGIAQTNTSGRGIAGFIKIYINGSVSNNGSSVFTANPYYLIVYS